MRLPLALALLVTLTVPAALAMAKKPAPPAAAPAAPAPVARRVEPTADRLLTQSDAVSWLGGPLEDTFQQEEPATSDNDYDHVTVRGWYPKGWHPQTADAPPDRAIQAVVHVFADTAAAVRFYDFIRSRDESSTRRTDGPLVGFVVTPVDSLGDVAHVKSGGIAAKGGGKVSLATLSFRRADTFVQMQVWMADGSAVARATRIAREMDAKVK